MSLNEILCQISTFLAAGHETSSSALTWTLYALARAPAVQARLREALLLRRARCCRHRVAPFLRAQVSTGPTSRGLPLIAPHRQSTQP